MDSISEIQVADTDSEWDAEANKVEGYFEDEEGEHKKTTKSAAAILRRSRNTGCNEWLIKNLGTA